MFCFSEGQTSLYGEKAECIVESDNEDTVLEGVWEVDLYNLLVKEGKRVGGLFHSTC